jgi:hypothetical protein
MELNITELDNLLGNDDDYGYNQQHIQSSFEKIPENNVPIKVFKKGVTFQDQISPLHQALPRENSKMVRPKIPAPKPQISYEDILSKMGMFVSNGKLHLMDNNPEVYQKINQRQPLQEQIYQQRQQHQEQRQQQQEQIYQKPNVPANSYIYNKYFKEDLKPEVAVIKPKTLAEYKQLLILDLLEKQRQRQRIRQIKSTKLIMPTSNINFSGGQTGNLNKLFNFSKR